MKRATEIRIVPPVQLKPMFPVNSVYSDVKKNPNAKKVDLSVFTAAKDLVGRIHMEEKVLDYIVRLVNATRKPADFNLDLRHMIAYGASPRASIFLGLAARAHAFLSGRGYVTPQDVKSMAPDVLRHRILLSYEAEADGLSTDNIILQILERLEVP